MTLSLKDAADLPPRKKVCGCGCGNPLEPRVDGKRPTINGAEVNQDCYYGDISDVLEKHPIGGGGIRRG
ncbi:MAG: hypothetical protein AAB819_00225 [Patescibacteria group bacterium]